MEKMKVVIKGKYDERTNRSDFDVSMKGSANVIANGLATTLCSVCIDGDCSCAQLVKIIKQTYAQCVEKGEE